MLTHGGSERTTVWSSLKAALRTITRAGAHAILLANVRHDFDVDLAEALIGVGLRIIRNGVAVAQILANGFERLHLLLPGLRKIGFAAGAGGDAPEHVTRHRIFADVVGGDNVNGYP